MWTSRSADQPESARRAYLLSNMSLRPQQMLMVTSEPAAGCTKLYLCAHQRPSWRSGSSVAAARANDQDDGSVIDGRDW